MPTPVSDAEQVFIPQWKKYVKPGQPAAHTEPLSQHPNNSRPQAPQKQPLRQSQALPRNPGPAIQQSSPFAASESPAFHQQSRGGPAARAPASRWLDSAASTRLPSAARLSSLDRAYSLPQHSSATSALSSSTSARNKGTFNNREFPSLGDAAQAVPSAVSVRGASADGQSSHPSPPTPVSPASKHSPYSFLAGKVSTNWTSKLADAPRLPSPPPAPEPPPPSHPPAAPEPAPSSPAAPTGTWGAPASHAGNGGDAQPPRSKLIDALTSGLAGSQHDAPASLDAGTFRAQLAVRQSRQLIPLIARKGDATASAATAASAAAHGTKAVPAQAAAGHGHSQRMHVVGAPCPKPPPALQDPMRSLSGPGTDTRLVLKPLSTGGAPPGAAAAAAAGAAHHEDAAPGSARARQPTGGMVALVKSPSARKAATSQGMGAELGVTVSGAPAQRACVNGQKGSGSTQSSLPVRQPATTAAEQHAGLDNTPAGGLSQRSSTSSSGGSHSSCAAAPLPVARRQGQQEQQPAAAHTAVPSPREPVPAASSTPAAPVNSCSTVAPTTAAKISTAAAPVTAPAAAGAALDVRAASDQHHVPSSNCEAAAVSELVLPPEEEAFLRALGWTDSDDELDGHSCELTEEEIAAFKAMSAMTAGGHASSRCTTPHADHTPVESRTTSPLPYLPWPAHAAAGGVQYSSSSSSEQLGAPQCGSSFGGDVVWVEPLFPGVSKGWFAGTFAQGC